MRFIGGGTRCEWWFASQRLTVIEQSTASEWRKGSPHCEGNSFEGWRVVSKNYQKRGAGVTVWHRVNYNYTRLSEWNIQQCVVMGMNYIFTTVRTSVPEWDLMLYGLRGSGIWGKMEINNTEIGVNGVIKDKEWRQIRLDMEVKFYFYSSLKSVMSLGAGKMCAMLCWLIARGLGFLITKLYSHFFYFNFSFQYAFSSFT